MEPIPKSGLFYSNKLTLFILQAYEDVMGKNGLNAILNLAGLNQLVDNFPPDNMERGFDFAGISAIHLAIEEMVGPRGGRGLALRAGKVTFNDFMKNFGALAGLNDLEFKDLPLEARLRISLLAASTIFSEMTDQIVNISETEGEYLWSTTACPICWGRNDLDKPVCYLTVGFLQSMLTTVSGGMEFKVNESNCRAMGKEVCEIVIQKQPIPAAN